MSYSDVTKDQTSLYDKALALENYFSGPDSAFRYNQTVPAGHGEPAIERFLANKQGYCEQFAGTYAAMARSIGVPARVAVGFTPGTQDPTNPKLWRVTGKYAHAWPEVYLGRQLGWVPFEPTPNRGAPNAQGWTGRAPMQAPADGTSETVGSIPGVAPSSLVPVGPLPGEDPNRIETDGTTTTTVATTTTVPPDRPLVGLDSPIQILTTGGISIVLLAILGAGYLALVIALRARVWQRRRTAARDASAAVLVSWQECLEQLALLGIRQRPTETTEELAQRAAPYLDNLAPAFLGLAGTVEAAMFSPTVLDPADATAATQLTDALTHHVEARTTRARQWQDRLDPRPIVDDFRQRHTRPREDELV